MRRVSKALAAAFLLVALTTSNVYAAPSRDSSEPFTTKIIKAIKKVIGLDAGDLSLPHP